MSRFDILCVVRDEADLAKDKRLAQFVVDSHIKHHPRFEKTADTQPQITENGVRVIPQDLLKKYIVYAKQNYHPKLHSMDQDKVSKVYSELRREAQVRTNGAVTVGWTGGHLDPAGLLESW